MNKTKYEVRLTTRFKKDFRIAIKRQKNIELLKDIIDNLANDQTLPDKNRDHALSGDWVGYRECHITPDWLLIYKKDADILLLTLMRTGSHSDLSF